MRAGTERIIERKHSGGQFLYGNTVFRAGVALGEKHLFPADDIHNHQSPGQPQNGFQAVCQSGADRRLYHQAVYDDLNGMLFVFVQCDLLGQIVLIAVHTNTDITGFFCVFQCF